MAITTATSNTAANNVSHVISMPASVASNDMLLAIIGLDSGAAAITAWSNSFTELLDSNSATGIICGLAYKIAAGGETDTTATTTTERSNQIGVRIPAAEWANDGTAPVISTIATGSSTTPNATGVTFGWSATHNTIFVTVQYADDSAPPGPVTAWPSGYTDNNVTSNTATSAAFVAMAVKPSSAASSPEDAGAFTNTGTETWGAITIAVKGTALGGAPEPYYEERVILVPRMAVVRASLI